MGRPQKGRVNKNFTLNPETVDAIKHGAAMTGMLEGVFVDRAIAAYTETIASYVEKCPALFNGLSPKKEALAK